MRTSRLVSQWRRDADAEAHVCKGGWEAKISGIFAASFVCTVNLDDVC